VHLLIHVLLSCLHDYYSQCCMVPDHYGHGIYNYSQLLELVIAGGAGAGGSSGSLVTLHCLYLRVGDLSA
jgi:hypothetical protein